MDEGEMAETFEIQLNGEPRRIGHPMSLQQLLEELGITSGRIAVELNREIVKREDWPNRVIGPGDVLEVVHFVGGGSIEK